jgi:hypothetical protein
MTNAWLTTYVDLQNGCDNTACFIYGLFNEAVSRSDYIESNGKKNN